MDAEERQRRIAELHRKAEAIRAGKAIRDDPSILDTLDRLTRKVEDLGDLAEDVSKLREGLANAIEASEADTGELPPLPQRRRDHLRLIRGEKEAG